MTGNAPLLVVDLQTEMFGGAAMPPMHQAEAVLARVRALLAWARVQGRKVAFIRHDGPSGDSLAPGAPGWELWPELGRAETEPVFGKTVGDAFSNPELGAWVAAQGAAGVIVLGAQTEHCVAATVHGALASGLAVTVVTDAHSTWDASDFGRQGDTATQVIAAHNASFGAAGARLVATDELLGH